MSLISLIRLLLGGDLDRVAGDAALKPKPAKPRGFFFGFLGRIRKLEGEVERYKFENEQLIEQFIRWQYNAQKRGVSKAMLDEHLPVIDRDSSEKKR